MRDHGLYKTLLDEYERHHMFSLYILNSIVTKERIDSHIRSHGGTVDAQTLDNISEKKLRLFAILVLVRHEWATSTVLERFNDESLPLGDIDEVPKSVGHEEQRWDFWHKQKKFFPKLTCEESPQQLQKQASFRSLGALIKMKGMGLMGQSRRSRSQRAIFRDVVM